MTEIAITTTTKMNKIFEINQYIKNKLRII